ncbi:MAG: hypothetical protein U1F57_01330 [bacterium]
MRKNFFRLLSISLLVSLLVSCGGVSTTGTGGSGNGTGNGDTSGANPLTPTPPVPVFGNFLLQPAASIPSGGSSASQSAIPPASKGLVNLNLSISLFNDGLRISQTRQSVNSISFKPDHGSTTTIQYPQTYVVQLIKDGAITDQEFPDFGAQNLPADTYHEFEMKFKNLGANEIPGGLLNDVLTTLFLVDHSIVVEGSFLVPAHVGLGGLLGITADIYLPFRIISHQEVNIRVSSPNAFTVNGNQDNHFFMAFRVEDWFAGGILQKLQNLSPADIVGGVIQITEGDSNPLIQEILSLFEQNVNLSVKSAPSADGVFDETDVDNGSFSTTF